MTDCHQDPPASLTDHSAHGTAIVDEVTGLPLDPSKGPHAHTGTDDIPHGERHTATGEQLTAGNKYHDPANMGYGQATLPGTDVPGSTTGTHGTTATGAHGSGTTGTHGTSATGTSETTESGREILSTGPEQHSIVKGY